MNKHLALATLLAPIALFPSSPAGMATTAAAATLEPNSGSDTDSECNCCRDCNPPHHLRAAYKELREKHRKQYEERIDTFMTELNKKTAEANNITLEEWEKRNKEGRQFFLKIDEILQTALASDKPFKKLLEMWKAAPQHTDELADQFFHPIQCLYAGGSAHLRSRYEETKRFLDTHRYRSSDERIFVDPSSHEGKKVARICAEFGIAPIKIAKIPKGENSRLFNIYSPSLIGLNTRLCETLSQHSCADALEGVIAYVAQRALSGTEIQEDMLKHFPSQRILELYRAIAQERDLVLAALQSPQILNSLLPVSASLHCPNSRQILENIRSEAEAHAAAKGLYTVTTCAMSAELQKEIEGKAQVHPIKF